MSNLANHQRDRRVAAAVRRTRTFRVGRPPPVRRPRSPWRVLIGTITALTILGATLLSLPIASEAGREASVLDAVFTSASAVSTTGLVTVDTATQWSPFGELVILVLIQVGGFAFMTGSTLLLKAIVGGRSSLQQRLRVQAAGGLTDLGDLGRVVRRVALFTLICEGVGAGLLLGAFLVRDEEPLTAVWWSVFHSVSAFNNAGFDLFGGFRSVTHLSDAPEILVPLGGLIVLGGTGYAIVADVLTKRRWVLMAIETKLVVAGTAILVVGGTLATAVVEWANPATLGDMDPPSRVLNAAFHSVSLRSAGFDSIGVAGLLDASLAVAIVLMFIGGASGSTAGGIRINTVAALVVASLSAARGLPSATAFRRRLPHQVVYRAVAVASVAIAGAFGLAMLLGAVEPFKMMDLVFEGVSALGTVGLSTVGSGNFSPISQIMLTIAMVAGRLGPLALAFAFAARARPLAYRPPAETVRIG